MYFYDNGTQTNIVIGKFRYSNAITMGIIIFMTFFSLAITVLNILVVLTYLKNKHLLGTKNYLILSLAFGDIVIAIIPVNSFTPYLIYGYWPFGTTACNIFLVLSYSICTVSTLTLLCIAVDRLLAVYFPIFHRINYTKFKVLFAVIMLWILAFLIWMPGMIIFPNDDGYNCYVTFINNWYLSLITAFCSYYGPLLFTIISYVGIYYKLVHRHNRMYKKRKLKLENDRVVPGDQSSLDSAEDCVNNMTTKFIKKDRPPSYSNVKGCVDIVEKFKGEDSDLKYNDAGNHVNSSTTSKTKGSHKNGKDSVDMTTRLIAHGCPNENNGISKKRTTIYEYDRNHSSKKTSEHLFNDMYVNERARKRNEKTHRRSLRLLLLVILAFAVAWLPYHVLLTYVSTGKSVPIPYWNFAYICGWANSLFNPFCYAFGNSNFKKAFISLFRKTERMQRPT